jgi:hypothetical protein
MEVLKVLSISIGVSFAIAALGWFALSVGLEPLERLRQQSAARAKERVDVERARA